MFDYMKRRKTRNTVEELTTAVARRRAKMESLPELAIPAIPEVKPSRRKDVDFEDEGVAKNVRSHDRMETGSTPYTLYLREIGQTGLITPQQEVELAKRIKKGDEAAREQMIK